MADIEQSLKILVELGVIGQADVKAATELIREAGDAAGKDLATSLPEGSELWAKYKNVLDQSGEAGGKFSVHGREMKMVLNQLDQAIPGLGKSIEGLGKVITGTGGGMIVLQLAIEATKVYWDLYQQSVAAAEQQTATKFDKMRETARNALQELEAYQAKLAEVSKSGDPTADKLAADRAKLAAEFKNQRDLLKEQETAALANATSPGQKESVQASFASRRRAMDEQESIARATLLETTIGNLRSERDAAQKEIARLQNEMAPTVQERGRKMGLAQSTEEEDAIINKITAKLSAQGKIATDAQEKITRYSTESDLAGATMNVNHRYVGTINAAQSANLTHAGNTAAMDSGDARAIREQANRSAQTTVQVVQAVKEAAQAHSANLPALQQLLAQMARDNRMMAAQIQVLSRRK